MNVRHWPPPGQSALVMQPLPLLVPPELVAAFRCAPFGSGSGGPNRQPAFVQIRKLHLPPGQSAFVVQLPLWLEPPEQRLLPASAGVVPLSVSDVPAQAVTFVTV